MKKVLLFLATCCMAMGAMAQVQVLSDGEVRITPSTSNASK